MDNTPNGGIDKYIENPDNLIELCESVLNELIRTMEDSDLTQMRAQLIEVSRSIDQLNNLSIGIPNELRDLKLNLMTEIEVQSQNRDKLETLLVGLQDSINRVNKIYVTKYAKKIRRRRRKTGTTKPRTSLEVIRAEIIGALKSLGGSGKTREVMNIIEESMRDRLLEGDFEELSDGRIVWKNRVHTERNKMRQEGILRNDSPRGVWELSGEYK